ncbi:hypothetical protein L3X38_032140 [Prunus dulcis]|uniref:Uncharacterized protein n=1 Tax=Prunus dulcis TaxID=3755 RepID=A0AAD4VEJ7_PRUDU|nr:hypothetical protein L3X38_032140 [Prunus dulcis]
MPGKFLKPSLLDGVRLQVLDGVMMLHFMRGRCNGIGAWVFNSAMNGVILLTSGGYSGCDGSEVKFVAGGSCSFGLGGNGKKGKEL